MSDKVSQSHFESLRTSSCERLKWPTAPPAKFFPVQGGLILDRWEWKAITELASRMRDRQRRRAFSISLIVPPILDRRRRVSLNPPSTSQAFLRGDLERRQEYQKKSVGKPWSEKIDATIVANRLWYAVL